VQSKTFSNFQTANDKSAAATPPFQASSVDQPFKLGKLNIALARSFSSNLSNKTFNTIDVLVFLLSLLTSGAGNGASILDLFVVHQGSDGTMVNLVGCFGAVANVDDIARS
jgi:hypothetical protein